MNNISMSEQEIIDSVNAGGSHEESVLFLINVVFRSDYGPNGKTNGQKIDEFCKRNGFIYREIYGPDKSGNTEKKIRFTKAG